MTFGSQWTQSQQCFFKLDAPSSYHQVKLSDNAKSYMNFLLPFGKFKYEVGAMGYINSGTEWNRRTDQILQGAPCIKQVDDIMGQACDYEQLAANLRETLVKCREGNITLSRKKVEVGARIHYSGYIVSSEGCFPDPQKVAVLKEFAQPEDQHDLRVFLGLTQQMSSFMPDLSHATKRLRGLLQKDSAWLWLPEHEADFLAVKEMMSDTAHLVPFDGARKTRLITDASRRGLGWLLVQQDEEGRWRLVRAGSAALGPSQRNYPAIQLELLGAAHAMEKNNFYLRGCPRWELVTDHAPLRGLFQKDLWDISPKLAPLVERTAKYSFTTVYLKGKKNLACDALSRFPLFGSEEVSDPNLDEGLGDDKEIYTCAMVNAEVDEGIREDPLLADVLFAVQDDIKYKEASLALRQGLSKDDIKRLPTEHGARQFMSIWDHLGVLDDRPDTIMLYEGHRIVVPAGSQQKILQLLHLPHSGIVKTKKAATQRYYFAGMTGRIEQMVQGCATCQLYGASKPVDPPIQTKPEKGPMERIGVDLFKYSGDTYLVMIDYFSHFPLIKKFGKSSSTAKVIKAMGKWFDLYGYPRHCRHDGGGEFRTKFKEYLHHVGIRSELSSAYNAPSNGRVERAVGQLKQLLKRAKAARECFFTSLAEWRLAPRSEGASPSQLFHKRNVRSGRLPEVQGPLDMEVAQEKKEASQRRSRDKRTTRHPRKMLAMHQSVLMQDQKTKLWSISGKVVAIRPSGKSYIVRTKNGTYLRGIRYIKVDRSGADHAAFIVLSAKNEGNLVSCMKGRSQHSVGQRAIKRKVTFNSTV